MKKIVLLIVLFTFLSCKKETKGFDEKNLLKPVDFGEYHTIGKNDLKVFLPEGFKKLTQKDKQQFINSIENKEAKDYVHKMNQARKFSKGKFYDFYNEELSSEVVVSTFPYTPFNKSSAIQLLYLIENTNSKFEELTGIVHEKQKSTYYGVQGLQIFKAIYKLFAMNEQTGEYDEILYKTVYLVTSNQKTFAVNITTPYELDFAPFIKKTKL